MMNSDHDLLLHTSRFDVVRHRQQLAGGEVRIRESVQHPGAVAILPLLADDRICLIANHRIAVGRTLIEIPAGTLEPPEEPAVAAARELTEETGYVAGRIEPLFQMQMSPGILNERMHVYVASELRPGPMALEAGEQIETLLVRWEEAFRMIRDGRIEDAKTVATLLFYQNWRSA